MPSEEIELDCPSEASGHGAKRSLLPPAHTPSRAQEDPGGQLLSSAATTNHGDLRAVGAACVAGLGPLIFGYTLGFTSPAQLPMEVGGGGGGWAFDAVFEAHLESSGVVSSQAPVFGAVVNVGAMLGATLAGPIADRLGRRRAIAGAALPWIAAWAAIALGRGYYEVLAGRLLCGVGVGIASMAVPLYISETSPTAIRGALGAVNQLAVTLGIFAVYLLGGLWQREQPTRFGCDASSGAPGGCPAPLTCAAAGGVCRAMLAPWRLLALVAVALSCALLLCALLLLPESPAWLARRGDVGAARRVLSRLRSSEAEAADELTALARGGGGGAGDDGDGDGLPPGGHPPPRGPCCALLAPLLARDVRWPFAIGGLLMLFQQFSGVNAVIFYSSDILQSGGISDPNLGGIVIMAVQVLMTGVAVLLMDRAGRRALLLVSLGGMCVCAGAMGAFHLNGQQPTWLALASLVGYIVSFSLGLGAIPWLLMGELFPPHVRAQAASAATLLNWSFSFAMTLGFADLNRALGPAHTFFLFAAICAAGAAFVATCVPETKGKSLEEIQALFR